MSSDIFCENHFKPLEDTFATVSFSKSFQSRALIFSLTAKMNSLEIRVKASTVKISFRNVFGNTLDFVREWDINSNK